MQKKAYSRNKTNKYFRYINCFWNKMWKIVEKNTESLAKSMRFSSIRNIRIIFNIIEKDRINPFPIDQADYRN